MKHLVRNLSLVLILIVTANPSFSEEENSIENLYFLVGEWSGRTTLYFPNQPERGQENETFNLVCEKVLSGAYVRCQALLERENGKTREWLASFNYHPEEKVFYVLYQYGNYPDIVRFPLKLENEGNSLSGYVYEEKPEGSVAVEKIIWEFSENKTKITAREYYDVTDDNRVNWKLGFDFELKKK